MDKISKLLNDYETFKEKMLLYNNSKDVYEEYHRIHFYEEFKTFLETLEFVKGLNENDEYLQDMLEKIGDRDLEELYYIFLNLEHGHLGMLEDIEDFVRGL